MFLVCTALYCEGAPLIQKLGLKKDAEHHYFQVFRNDTVVLIITGTGKIKAAAAVAYILGLSCLDQIQLAVNIGICGSRNHEIGEAVLAHKVMDLETCRSVYPDILLRHDFKEDVLYTLNCPAEENTAPAEGICDMEAWGFFTSAALFLPRHKIQVVKIVSDVCNGSFPNQQQISKLIGSWADGLERWLFFHEAYVQAQSAPSEFSAEENRLYDQICRALHLTVAVSSQLKQILKAWKVMHGEIPDPLKDYAQMRCASSKEGKKYFEEIRQQLFPS